ncbi:MAG: hypothetical protein QM754_15965 [Tepidisphaeraceae bacterium]
MGDLFFDRAMPSGEYDIIGGDSMMSSDAYDNGISFPAMPAIHFPKIKPTSMFGGPIESLHASKHTSIKGLIHRPLSAPQHESLPLPLLTSMLGGSVDRSG